jgi:hypothetical protein
MSDLDENGTYVIDFEYDGTRLARVKVEIVKIIGGKVGFEIIDILNVYSPLKDSEEFERGNLKHGMFTASTDDFLKMKLS